MEGQELENRVLKENLDVLEGDFLTHARELFEQVAHFAACTRSPQAMTVTCKISFDKEDNPIIKVGGHASIRMETIEREGQVLGNGQLRLFHKKAG